MKFCHTFIKVTYHNILHVDFGTLCIHDYSCLHRYLIVICNPGTPLRKISVVFSQNISSADYPAHEKLAMRFFVDAFEFRSKQNILPEWFAAENLQGRRIRHSQAFRTTSSEGDAIIRKQCATASPKWTLTRVRSRGARVIQVACLETSTALAERDDPNRLYHSMALYCSRFTLT